jgi:hypothetical protein
MERSLIWEYHRQSPALVLIDAASGQQTEIFKNSNPKRCFRGRFSPDGRWLSFHIVPGPEARRVYVVPFKGAVLHDEKAWIPITDGEGMERYADWSPDGNVLYFLSERDGFRCIRGQRLDPATKHPVGPPFDVIPLPPRPAVPRDCRSRLHLSHGCAGQDGLQHDRNHRHHLDGDARPAIGSGDQRRPDAGGNNAVRRALLYCRVVAACVPPHARRRVVVRVTRGGAS